MGAGARAREELQAVLAGWLLFKNWRSPALWLAGGLLLILASAIWFTSANDIRCHDHHMRPGDVCREYDAYGTKMTEKTYGQMRSQNRIIGWGAAPLALLVGIAATVMGGVTAWRQDHREPAVTDELAHSAYADRIAHVEPRPLTPSNPWAASSRPAAPPPPPPPPWPRRAP